LSGVDVEARIGVEAPALGAVLLLRQAFPKLPDRWVQQG
jgi:hypothetical protein